MFKRKKKTHEQSAYEQDFEAFMDFLHISKKNTIKDKDVYLDGRKYTVLVDKPEKKKWYKRGK